MLGGRVLEVNSQELLVGESSAFDSNYELTKVDKQQQNK